MKKNSVVSFFIMVAIMVFFTSFSINASAATAADPYSSGPNIYVQGTPILIEAGTTSGYTAISYMKSGVKTYLAISGATGSAGESGYDLSGYAVYGGFFGSGSIYAGNTSITMTGGKIDIIYGGSRNVMSSVNTIDGNTNINISGGEVNLVYGGGIANQYDPSTGMRVIGTANIKISGGTYPGITVHGGGVNSGAYVENTIVEITGGTLGTTGNGGVWGGGVSSTVNSATVKISGGKMTHVYGGGYDNSRTTSTDVEISGNAHVQYTVFGGNVGDGNTVSSNLKILGGVVGAVYGGSSENSVDGMTSSLTISGGTINGICKPGDSINDQRTSGITFTISGKPTIIGDTRIGSGGVMFNGSGTGGSTVGGVDSFDASNLEAGAIIYVHMIDDNPIGKLIATGVTQSNLPYIYFTRGSYGTELVGGEIRVTAHTAVTDIDTVPNTAEVNQNLILSGNVSPSNASYQNIEWSVQNAGTTGAVINGNVFNATSTGTATITATISAGSTSKLNYTKNFDIVVVFLPKITNGANQTFEQGQPFTVTSNQDFSNFEKVEILLSKSSLPVELLTAPSLSNNNIRVANGSIIATVTGEYTATLPLGTHTIAIYADGTTASTQFTIVAPNSGSTSSSTSSSAQTQYNPAISPQTGVYSTSDSFELGISNSILDKKKARVCK